MFAGALIMVTLIFVHALGDCADGEHCDHGILLDVLLPTLAIAAAMGLMVSLIVNRIDARRR